MSGDNERILRLWEEKTGQREPEDLSRVLPVQMGSWTEELNRYWFERETGRVVKDEGAECVHPERPWMTCTLDGLTLTGPVAVFEAKHVSAFAKEDEVVQRYMPQLHHNMVVCGLEHAALSVFFGTMKWQCFEVEADPFYLDVLVERERAFWDAVESSTPPVEMAPVAAPVEPSEYRSVDMQGNNEWGAFAADWLETVAAKKKHDKAAKGLKALIEDDVGEATGHGLAAKRDKRGAIRISEAK
jgi:predicted phage-related endonuclease